MRNKRLLRTLSALCLTLVLASGFTVPAFAQGLVHKAELLQDRKSVV